MSLLCPSCQRQLEFVGPPPTFCGYCGQRLGEAAARVTVDDPAQAPTLPPRAPEDTETAEPGRRAAPSTPIPETIGTHQVVRRLGSGDMGSVYEAVDTASGRRVALKLVQDEHAASPEVIDRFRQEGELASKLVHPRCVFVLAVDED